MSRLLPVSEPQHSCEQPSAIDKTLEDCAFELQLQHSTGYKPEAENIISIDPLGTEGDHRLGLAPMITARCGSDLDVVREAANFLQERKNEYDALRKRVAMMSTVAPPRRHSDPDVERPAVETAKSSRKRRFSQTELPGDITNSLQRLYLGIRPRKYLRVGCGASGIVGTAFNGEAQSREEGEERADVEMADAGGLPMPDQGQEDENASLPDQETTSASHDLAVTPREPPPPSEEPRPRPTSEDPFSRTAEAPFSPSPPPIELHPPQLDPLALDHPLPTASHVEEPHTSASVPSPAVLTVFSNGKTSITLHPILAKNLRAHQVEGLQFLWKEIAVAPEPPERREFITIDDKKVFVPPCSGGGALLAHTMGLGKTVTVIAFLFMLGEVQGRRPYETANSSLPYHFKMGAHPSRVLILVPGGLLQNWLLELQTWAAKFPSVEGVSSPGKTLIDSVYTMFGINDLDTRIEVIKEWYENGGILLLGHGMFRALVKPKTSSHRDPGQRDDINNYLLYPGPEIVIADEAHAFKTHRSKLTEAVQLIQTRSKIALTASPLSNNLFEFWSLIRWVWQDCRIALTFKMFRKTYVTPIAVGFNRVGISPIRGEGDSEDEDEDMSEVDDEVSKTSIAARKLKEIIEATAKKIHRKNISTIKELLKPKTEFILRVSLTKDQVELYNDFLEDSSGLKESSIWRHFCLRAVCNHPEIFRIVSERDPCEESEELLRIKKKRKGKRRKSMWDGQYVGDGSLLEKALERLLEASEGADEADGAPKWPLHRPNGIILSSNTGVSRHQMQESLLELSQIDNISLEISDDEEKSAEEKNLESASESGQQDDGLPQGDDGTMTVEENLEETGTRVSDVIKDAPEVSTANSGSTTQPRTLLASSSKSSNTLKEAKAIALRRANEAIEQSSKFKLLFALVSEFKAIGDRVLLFSHSIDTLSYLYNLARLLGFTVLRLDGSVPFPQRQTDLASFNGGTFDIYLVSTKAGGVGLNLQCANRVIILDNDHSPLWEQQAIGRSYRLGQTKEVFVYRFLVEKTLETRVAREKYRKVRLADIVVDGNWVKRRGYARHGDHRTVWEKAHYTEAPSEVVKDGWCGRDQVLDKVVDSLGIVTEVILDEDETTFTG